MRKSNVKDDNVHAYNVCVCCKNRNNGCEVKSFVNEEIDRLNVFNLCDFEVDKDELYRKRMMMVRNDVSALENNEYKNIVSNVVSMSMRKVLYHE